MENGTYDASYSEVFDEVLQLINRLGWTVESADDDTGIIVTSTGFSLRSWSERVTIRISREGTQTKVSVASAPKAQLIDWGKSRENERVIIRELNCIFGG